VAGDGQLVLGVPEALLDLPTVVTLGAGVDLREELARLFGLAASVLHDDLLGRTASSTRRRAVWC
jgi:hypothetical protein